MRMVAREGKIARVEIEDSCLRSGTTQAELVPAPPREFHVAVIAGPESACNRAWAAGRVGHSCDRWFHSLAVHRSS